jgi:hypothetical protein
LKSRFLDPDPWSLKFRIIWYGSLLVIALVLGFVVGVPQMGERLTVKVIDRVENAFGVTLEADSGDWNADGTVTLSGLKVLSKNAPDGETPLMRAQTVEIKADVEYLARRVRLISVDVSGVKLHVKQRADGSTNIRGVLRGLSKLGGPKKEPKAGVKPSSLGFLKRNLPKVQVKDLEVSLEMKRPIPGLGRLGRPIRFLKGSLTVENTAVVKEANNATLNARFEGTSITPKLGLGIQANISVKHGFNRASLTFDGPIAFPVKSREVSLERLSYEKKSKSQVASLEGLTLSLDRKKVPTEPDVRIGAIRVLLDPARSALDIAREIRRLGFTREGIRGVQEIEINQPSFVFQNPDLSAEFDALRQGLQKLKASPPDESGPDKALGVLMEASRAAAKRLTGKGKRQGPLLKSALNRVWAKVAKHLNLLAPAMSKLTSVFPMDHITLKEGIFSWQRDGATGETHALEHRFENFNLSFQRTPEGTSVVEASFVVPTAEQNSNNIRATIDDVTGQTQLDLKLKKLPLFPYRHVAPDNLPITKKTSLTDTDFTLIWSPQTGIAKVFGKATANYITLSAPRLAEDLLTNMRLQGDFDATLNLNTNMVSLHKSSFRLGSLRTNIHGSFNQLADSPILEGTFQLERIRCQEIVDSLPTAFIPKLKSMKVQGTFGLLLNFKLDTARVDELQYEAFPALHGFGISDTGILDFEAVRGTFTHRLQEADGTIREFQVGPDAPHWVPLSEISKYMPKAITTTEDGSFFRHNGFSGYAIRQSIITNLKKGGFYRGASTVSQQLVKNLFLSRAKTISRKLQEMFITWRLEKILDKTRLMELYLNVIELGPGIYGIKHAARHYFDKHPRDLSLLESVFIASLIPSPNRYYKQFARGEVTPGWRRYLRTLIGVMRQRDKITQLEYAAAAPYSPIFRGQKDSEPEGDEDIPAPPVNPWVDEPAP